MVVPRLPQIGAATQAKTQKQDPDKIMTQDEIQNSLGGSLDTHLYLFAWGGVMFIPSAMPLLPTFVAPSVQTKRNERQPK